MKAFVRVRQEDGEFAFPIELGERFGFVTAEKPERPMVVAASEQPQLKTGARRVFPGVASRDIAEERQAIDRRAEQASAATDDRALPRVVGSQPFAEAGCTENTARRSERRVSVGDDR